MNESERESCFFFRHLPNNWPNPFIVLNPYTAGSILAMESEEMMLKAKAVWLILDLRPEEALRILCKHYKIEVPELKVGLPKKHSKVAGCYVVHQRTIYVADRETLYNPFVILHEFYHHLRSASGKHKGNEKYADNFAIDFIDAYRQAIKAAS